MLYTLGLDISTACCGWAIVNEKKQLIDSGWIDLTKKDLKGDLFAKIDRFKQEIKIKALCYMQLNQILVEAPARNFTKGMSNTNTIQNLIMFNFGVCLTLYNETTIKPELIAVSTARKSFGISIPKGTPHNKKKEYVLTKVEEKYPHIVWTMNKKGNRDKKNYDRADAIVIACTK